LRASWLPNHLALCAKLGAAASGAGEVAAAATAAAAAEAAGDSATAAALTLAAKKARAALRKTEVFARRWEPFATVAGADGASLDAELELDLRAPAAAGMLKLTKHMIKRGAEVDAGGGDLGDTPLMVAAQAGHTHVVKALLHAGADAAAKRRADGATAVELAKQHPGVVKLLTWWLQVKQRKAQGRCGVEALREEGGAAFS
jgi:hypothetical protein